MRAANRLIQARATASASMLPGTVVPRVSEVKSVEKDREDEDMEGVVCIGLQVRFMQNNLSGRNSRL